jgi:signal peptidase II
MSRGWAWFVAAVVVCLDQLSKWWVIHHMPLGSVKTLTPFFQLWHLRNTGAAFSFLAGSGGWQLWLFNGLACVIVLVIARMLWRRMKRPSVVLWALALILGGAVGNLIDRIRWGYVVDFIAWHVHQWYWPVFNVADSAITVGVVLYMVFLFRSERRKAASQLKKEER